ncbi:MAG: hypothetical protein UV79_C0021G0003 [candidate division TM6 bacterium GW2011_GWF2_43_17]|nr:MAG: hypothetical protein UV79_C0021G0003 [candidate division TM6 bacterium GW2011_GWF2_43_17]HAU30451.1 hypothetical protein [Candidatus Dependentiae bacterium]
MIQANTSLYGDKYAELYKNSPHRRTLANANMTAEAKSPACGDQVTFSGIITDGIITQLAFTGSGSMLSQIFAELLCQYAEKKPASEIFKLTEHDVKTLLPLEMGPTRFALLVFILNGLKEGLSSHA